jgi:sugar lactone lactonase YvrE
MAFNNAGNLFVSDEGTYTIVEFTPGGTESPFASGLIQPIGLAFNSAGNLFVADRGDTIYEYTPGGTQSVFATGIDQPGAIAFQPVPEPSTLALLAVAATALLGRRPKTAIRPG